MIQGDVVELIPDLAGSFDLVFIDPIGTGFSFPHPGADTKKFWGAVPDAQSVGEFVRMYLNESDRYGDPGWTRGT